MKDGLYPDDLRAAIEFIDWLNENAGDGSTMLKFTSKILIENPEHAMPIGWALWHGDGFWYFKEKL